MMRRQSDRSFAAAGFFLTCAIVALSYATVFNLDDGTGPGLLVTAVCCFVVALGILVAGRRFSRTAAGTVMACLVLTVVPGVWVSSSEVRALPLGFLFFPFFLYVLWFLPLWFARLLGYGWLVLFSWLMLAKFGQAPASMLFGLSLSAVGLGELVSHFKRRLEREAITDPLCGIWNRRGFERLLERAVATARRNEQPLSLVYLDLDDFKVINDRRGHLAGDQALRSFAHDMQRCIRVGDVFARFGGDEFALLIIDCDADQARLTVERLRREVTGLAWSFGIAECRRGEDASEFISRADLRMFEDKEQRKLAARQDAGHSRIPVRRR